MHRACACRLNLLAPEQFHSNQLGLSLPSQTAAAALKYVGMQVFRDHKFSQENICSTLSQAVPSLGFCCSHGNALDDTDWDIDGSCL